MREIILSLHIIFIVTWFSGLFYIVRLFVYLVEARTKPEPARSILENQYKLMCKRLWYGITWPSFVLTLILGIWLLTIRPDLLKLGYMHIKLTFVVGLIVYQVICHLMYLKLQKGEGNFTSSFLRIWNEVATLFLVAIVFVIVMKNEMNWIYGTLGFFLFGLMLMLAIKLYKRLRQRSHP